MKKWLIPLIIILVVGFGVYRWAVGFNNTAVELNENVSEAWGNVQTSYQRRNDLIGNLVNTVKGAADFERTTLTEVIEARSKATQTTIDPSNITPEQLKQFNEAQGGLSSALSRLLVTVERYPDLKANQNFLKLQDELTSTENTIQTARTRYNEAIKPYNNHVKKFPNSILAGMFGFEGKPYFDSEPGAEKPVEVDFQFD
ncbi:LemA family protein [Mangrovimonas sp. AS39]|uniref:LemA family protein n=1 Tax=Mangrovimonas futianensis TaxID=2895523 RepID=UPI001E42D5DF|nr:LemA family protein [Mangrovimonas futianensis]MCF1192527.1 LemA family protein [Mangrovimonas futianensis]MCF1196143.1 LemA family protein [Mangrovimonas futianensis]MCF1422528.1 LemA family protein [Mangrovimonas futianensis]